MPRYIDAKEFRQRFSTMAEKVKGAGETTVLKRSIPRLQVEPCCPSRPKAHE
ncbi:MAG: hypothetical protein JRJ16_18920 [Deltaproteobacteria bacterium]|nr:hypothetical protein [Deltaproteobacteria bacterium]